MPNHFQELSEELARRTVLELTRAGFPPDVSNTPIRFPLPNLLTRPPRRYMEASE